MTDFSEQVREVVERTGGRMTAQRQLIIDLLESSGGPFEVEEFYRLVQAKDPRISIATIYRTLKMLEVAGLIQQRYRSHDHERRYYERVRAEPVYHFSCHACHKMIPFHSSLVQEIGQRLATELGLAVFSACVCLDGLCPDCLDKAKTNTAPDLSCATRS